MLLSPRWALLALCATPLFGADPTFSRDVAPILYNHCVGCHRAGDIAPMSLITYKETRPWAAAIREAVSSRKMPPWGADPKHGRFVNDPRLTDAELVTIRTWVAAGSPEGSPKDLPPVPKFSDEWHIGQPEAVVDIGEDHKIASEGPDEYTYFTVPTNFTEDRWVKAVELLPGNRRVVHHAHVWIEEPAKADAPKKPRDIAPTFMFKRDNLGHMNPDAPVKNDGCSTSESGNYWGRQGGQNGILGSYLPGKGPDTYPEGTAKLIPKGAKLKFQVHYSRTTGKEEIDRSKVGFVFASAPPERPLRRMDISNYLFLIPPGADNQEVTECHTFDHDVELLSMTAHMHLRGKDMRFDIERPDGTRETLLNVPRYSFAWQQTYREKTPVRIEKGTRLIITAHFDNSSGNKWNPDPQKLIRWGEPSNEEMMDGWLEYVDAAPPAKLASNRR